LQVNKYAAHFNLKYKVLGYVLRGFDKVLDIKNLICIIVR